MVRREFSAQVIQVIEGTASYELCLDYLHYYDLAVFFNERQLPLSRYNIYDGKIILVGDISEYVGQYINIERRTPPDIDYEQERGRLDAHSLEKALDRITLILQESRRIVCVLEPQDTVEGLCPPDIQRVQRSANLNWDFADLSQTRRITTYDARLGFYYGDNTLAEAFNVVPPYSFSNPKIPVYVRVSDGSVPEPPQFDELVLEKSFTIEPSTMDTTPVFTPFSKPQTFTIGENSRILPESFRDLTPSFNRTEFIRGYLKQEFFSEISTDIGTPPVQNYIYIVNNIPIEIIGVLITYGTSDRSQETNECVIMALVPETDFTTLVRLESRRDLRYIISKTAIKLSSDTNVVFGRAGRVDFNDNNRDKRVVTSGGVKKRIISFDGSIQSRVYNLNSIAELKIKNLNPSNMEIDSVFGQYSVPVVDPITATLPIITAGENSTVLPQNLRDKFGTNKDVAHYIRGFILSQYVPNISTNIGSTTLYAFTLRGSKVYAIGAFTGSATIADRTATTGASPPTNLGHFLILAVPQSLRKPTKDKLLTYFGFVKTQLRNVERSNLNVTLSYSGTVTINSVVCDIAYLSAKTTSADSVNFYIEDGDELGLILGTGETDIYTTTVENRAALLDFESRIMQPYFTYEDPDNPGDGTLWRFIIEYNHDLGIAKITGPTRTDRTEIYFSLIVNFARGRSLTFANQYLPAGKQADGSRGMCTIGDLTTDNDFRFIFRTATFNPDGSARGIGSIFPFGSRRGGGGGPGGPRSGTGGGGSGGPGSRTGTGSGAGGRGDGTSDGSGGFGRPGGSGGPGSGTGGLPGPGGPGTGAGRPGPGGRDIPTRGGIGTPAREYPDPADGGGFEGSPATGNDLTQDGFNERFANRLASTALTRIKIGDSYFRPIFYGAIVNLGGQVLYEAWGCKDAEEDTCGNLKPEFAIIWNFLPDSDGRYNRRGYEPGKFFASFGEGLPLPNGIFMATIRGKTVFYEITGFEIYQKTEDGEDGPFYLSFRIRHSVFQGLQSDRSIGEVDIAQQVFSRRPTVRSTSYGFEIKDQTTINHFQDSNYRLRRGANFYGIGGIFGNRYSEKLNARRGLSLLIVNEASQVSRTMCPTPGPEIRGPKNINGSTRDESRLSWTVIPDNLPYINFGWTELNIDPNQFPIRASELSWLRLRPGFVNVGSRGSLNSLSVQITKEFTPKILIKAENPEFYDNISGNMSVDMVRAFPKVGVDRLGNQYNYFATSGLEGHYIRMKKEFCKNVLILSPETISFIEEGQYVFLNFKFEDGGFGAGAGIWTASPVTTQLFDSGGVHNVPIRGASGVSGGTNILNQVMGINARVLDWTTTITEEALSDINSNRATLSFGGGGLTLERDGGTFVNPSSQDLKALRINPFGSKSGPYYFPIRWYFDTAGNFRIGGFNSGQTYGHDAIDHLTTFAREGATGIKPGFIRTYQLYY